MALYIDTEQGILTSAKEGSGKARVINLPELGWDLKKNVEFGAQIPCFAGGGFPLPAEALLRADDGRALALILTGFPLEDEKALRIYADLYSNSAKRQYGQRPAVYFVSNGQCKAAHSLLGGFHTEPQLMTKAVYMEFIASHNIQETAVFHAILKNAELTKQFLGGKLNTQAMNAMLASVLQKAKAVGFDQYYNQLCPKEEMKKALPKQAVLLAGMGKDNYTKLIRQQVEALTKLLSAKSEGLIRRGAANDAWLPIPERPSLESRMLDWAFALYGWNRSAEVQKNVSVPCYLEPAMELLADYVFLDPHGKPVVVFLRDNLNLSKEKMFFTAEFYARSFKAAYGIVPFVVLSSKQGAMLKMGALSGGFAPVSQFVPRMVLISQVASVNITEAAAWDALQRHMQELRAIQDTKARTERQIQIARDAAEETKERMRDADYVKETFQRVSNDTSLPEETYWKAFLGDAVYQEQRRQELGFLRTFAADKRIAAGI